MRKLHLFTVFLLTLCLLLTGCGKSPQSAKQNTKALNVFTGNFEAEASIQYKGIDCSAKINRSPQEFALSFITPDTLEGMEVLFSQDKVEIRFKGLTFDFAPTTMPAQAVAALIMSAVDAVCKRDGLQVEESNGLLLVQGQAGGNAFTMEMDAQTGAITKLSIPAQELTVQFDSFAFSQ